jgi:nucleotide-binding universal stress UspA family protein
MKILLAVDGSAVSKRMLSYLAAHDELLGPKHSFSVLTVVPALPNFSNVALDRATMDEHYKTQADTVLHPIRAFIKQQAWQQQFGHTEMGHAVGQAAQAIAHKAESEGFDLVVMGTHGHSSLAQVVMGSVATGVLARCKVPVLLVH